MKLFRKIYAGLLLGVVTLSGCEAGLVYEDVPESIYTEVGVSECVVLARELFQDKIYAPNWGKWVPNYLSTVATGQLKGSANTINWTNKSVSAVTINGITVNPGETHEFKSYETTEDLAGAPDGKLYIFNIYSPSRVEHSTPNGDYYFDASKFSGDFELVSPNELNRSTKVIIPVRENEMIVTFTLVYDYNCVVTPQDGAPKLGIPGDFTAPRRYMVTNESRLPAGVERSRRLYEVRVTFLP